MKLTALVKKVNDRTDEVLAFNKVLGWFDDAQRQIGLLLNANFPSLLNDEGVASSELEPAIPDKYQESLVIYAVARYSEGEGDLQKMDAMDTRFDTMLKQIQGEYVPAPQYLDDAYTQQFVATEGQTLFVVTKDTYNDYTPVKVYVNNVEVLFSRNGGGNITLVSPAVLNDKVTIKWENNPTYNYMPEGYVGW